VIVFGGRCEAWRGRGPAKTRIAAAGRGTVHPGVLLYRHRMPVLELAPILGGTFYLGGA
jgi:hypothetical protein